MSGWKIFSVGKVVSMTFHSNLWMPHILLDLFEHRQDVISSLQAQHTVSGPPQKRVQIWAGCRWVIDAFVRVENLVKPLMSGMHARMFTLKIPLWPRGHTQTLSGWKIFSVGKVVSMTFHSNLWMPHILLDLFEHRQDVISSLQAQRTVSGPPQKRVQIWAGCRWVYLCIGVCNWIWFDEKRQEDPGRVRCCDLQVFFRCFAGLWFSKRCLAVFQRKICFPVKMPPLENHKLWGFPLENPKPSSYFCRCFSGVLQVVIF